MKRNATIKYYMIQYDTIKNGMTEYNMYVYKMIRNATIQYDIILYDTVCCTMICYATI